ncbi:zinc finger protein 511 [Battus philenor]|uniref:zinc finger protein 511 n=1 Tax=Battus philenor TaxID=42288 RepID=UPI0035CEF815
MDLKEVILRKLEAYGVGHRKLHDELFIRDKTPPRYGVYDVDDEDLCHEIIPTSCNVAGCTFTASSLLEYENHYNASHRYACSQCKKMLPSPHYLDLHLQEKHDSFFAVMATKKPSYSCYVEECKEKFMTPEERLDHCVKIHKLPKDFRFDQKPKKGIKVNKNNMAMDLDIAKPVEQKKFSLSNNKQKVFSKSCQKKLKETESNVMNIDN